MSHFEESPRGDKLKIRGLSGSDACREHAISVAEDRVAGGRVHPWHYVARNVRDSN
jgi:hypothetical protein